MIGYFERLIHLKIPHRHELEVGIRLVTKSITDNLDHHASLRLAVAAALLHGIDTAFEPLARPAVESPDEALFPIGPILVAGAHAVREREQHEGIEIFPIADDAAELLDRG